MELPITQEHIDNAKKIIAERERRKHVEQKIVPEIKPVKTKKRKKQGCGGKVIQTSTEKWITRYGTTRVERVLGNMQLT